MTGFARAAGQIDEIGWQWEVKSVNGRGLDLRIRLAPGSEGLEVATRAALAEKFSRGSFSVNLTVTRAGGSGRFLLNRDLLDQLLDVMGEVKARVPDAQAPQIDGLLRVKGVLEEVEALDSDETKAKREKAMMKSLGEALVAVAAARQAEGAKLAAVLSGHVDKIATLAAQATGLAGAQPSAIRDRLQAKLKDLLGGSGLSEERLAQEAALLAAKADVREEIDRLNAHVSQARELMAAGEPVGRRLDFLSQEFNREANTLCSKAEDLELTRVGLELKATIEQFREQVQNVE
ncbi:MAG TPA: YicC/YloC family endoribonuclease [Alphaproteobacteria bacterium]|jgi:uncharacterized protein (TIGR00255 family)